jgi:hypothetical protein
MKCNCFESVIEKVEASIECKNELEVKWVNRMFYLGGEGDDIPVALMIESEWRQTKVNGQPYRNKTKESVSIKMKFCPMCGLEWT